MAISFTVEFHDLAKAKTAADYWADYLIKLQTEVPALEFDLSLN